MTTSCIAAKPIDLDQGFSGGISRARRIRPASAMCRFLEASQVRCCAPKHDAGLALALWGRFAVQSAGPDILPPGLQAVSQDRFAIYKLRQAKTVTRPPHLSEVAIRFSGSSRFN
jgi:hypothetical protein